MLLISNQKKKKKTNSSSKSEPIKDQTTQTQAVPHNVSVIFFSNFWATKHENRKKKRENHLLAVLHVLGSLEWSSEEIESNEKKSEEVEEVDEWWRQREDSLLSYANS